MELNSHTNHYQANQTANQRAGYQVQRTTTIYLAIGLVLFIIICFAINFVALIVYFGHSNNVAQCKYALVERLSGQSPLINVNHIDCFQVNQIFCFFPLQLKLRNKFRMWTSIDQKQTSLSK